MITAHHQLFVLVLLLVLITGLFSSAPLRAQNIAVPPLLPEIPQRDYLAGDYDGIRTRLYERGVDLFANYQGEVFGNVSGGAILDSLGQTRQVASYDGLLPSELIWTLVNSSVGQEQSFISAFWNCTAPALPMNPSVTLPVSVISTVTIPFAWAKFISSNPSLIISSGFKLARCLAMTIFLAIPMRSSLSMAPWMSSPC